MKVVWFFALLAGSMVVSLVVTAQNPLVTDQFTADPTARVFDGKVYVYPSHDIRCEPGKGFIGFCMADYHVFSSSDLTVWVDHGVILSQEQVPWADPGAFTMWAPDCIYKNAKYYFFFPAVARDKTAGWGRRMGIAVADKPYGPFVPRPEPIAGVTGIDPNVFIDRDGQAYLYWANGGKLFAARLRSDLLEIDSPPAEIGNLPEKFKEGPFLFERNGLYYLTFPYVPATTEQLVYAMGKSPLGPFEYKGTIMKELPLACWTNHQSVVEYNGQWYLFYHDNELSPKFDKNRCIKADSLFFNADGTIREVKPSMRGVGITNAAGKVQVDRYSTASGTGISIAFTDTLDHFKGWKVMFEQPGTWIRYNKVDFRDPAFTRVRVRARSAGDGQAEIRLNDPAGPVIAKVRVTGSETWANTVSKLKPYDPGVHDLFLVCKKGTPLEIDWVQFE